MDIATEDLGDEITKITLRGRLDTAGAVQLGLPFNRLATEKRKVLVDLSNVSFLASYGIRVLLVGAKIVDGKNGKLVLSSPDPNVAKVLITAGIDQVIAIFDSESAAIAALKL
jgi:anti-sigma B factor antagonist